MLEGNGNLRRLRCLIYAQAIATYKNVHCDDEARCSEAALQCQQVEYARVHLRVL